MRLRAGPRLPPSASPPRRRSDRAAAWWGRRSTSSSAGAGPCEIASSAAISIASWAARSPRDARRRAQLCRLREQPQQLVHDAQHQECLVAFAGARARERARHALAGAMAVVDGAAREAAGGEFAVDPAAVRVREVPAGDACGLVEREVVRRLEGRRHAAHGGAAPAIGEEIESAHDGLARARRRSGARAAAAPGAVQRGGTSGERTRAGWGAHVRQRRPVGLALETTTPAEGWRWKRRRQPGGWRWKRRRQPGGWRLHWSIKRGLRAQASGARTQCSCPLGIPFDLRAAAARGSFEARPSHRRR
jgi:hypothetical protein